MKKLKLFAVPFVRLDLVYLFTLLITMKKTSSFNARNGVKKQQESKASSTTRGSSKVSGFGTSSAAFNRRSPVVTDQTIATNSVIQAATDPKIKELVMKQQQIFERESMDKRTPRNNSRDSRADGISSHFHTVDHSSTATSHQSFQQQQQFWKAALDIGDSGPSESSVDSPEKSYGNKFLASSPDTHQQQLHHYMQQQCATTPGSAVETVVHDIPVVSSHNDDDGAGSEVTADAGECMCVYVCLYYTVSVPLSICMFSFADMTCSLSLSDDFY